MGRLRALAEAMRAEEKSARGHAERVGSMCRRLALAVGLTADEADIVALAGQLHDVGVLDPSHPVDGDGPAHRRHPVIGAQLVAPFDVLGLAGPMIRYHHERLDGRGYPDGLRGAAIPIGARLIAVADEYDRLTAGADDVALTHDAALAHLVRHARGLDDAVITALGDVPLP